VQYRTITPENLADFHFHGDTGAFPLSAVIALPHDAKSGVLFEGRFDGPGSLIRIVHPT
jgi:putative ABC transport system permease protein